MRFKYLEPATIEEAVSLLTKYDGKARVIAGGTDLLVQIQHKAIKPEYVVDIGYIPGLQYLDFKAKRGLRIGTLSTIRSIEKSDEICRSYPVISQAAGLLGSMAIRNMATIGGNLCNAAPSADTAPALMALSARGKITGPNGEKVVPLEDFFTGPGKTVLEPADLLVEIQVPPSAPDTRGVYLKHARSAVDLATVGVAVVITLDGEICRDVKIVLGAVAPVPMRAKRAEKLLTGRRIDEALCEKAARAAAEEARPISDVRASADFRKEMVKVLTGRAIRQLTAN